MPPSIYLFSGLLLALSCLQAATFAVLSASVVGTNSLTGRALPNKIHGVNIGGWLVLEPWMLPDEWESMGGQSCDNCDDCIGSEFALVESIGNPAITDAAFKDHWETWFTQDHVAALASAGINTVRVPLGYWIVEGTVDRASEYYPTGGIVQLQRGLQSLSDARISVILDHHALPGVQTANQSFTGHCTTDVQFFTGYNYQRALVWAAVMTTISHVDPAFASVSTIEAANEPVANGSLTPGYGTYLADFVQVIRLIEFVLLEPLEIPTGTSTDSLVNISTILSSAASGFANASVSTSDNLQTKVPRANLAKLNFIPSAATLQAVATAAFLLPGIAEQLNLKLVVSLSEDAVVNGMPLTTGFMDILWWYLGHPINPANAANGPAVYDDHLYYAYGGNAAANEEAYMVAICNLDRIQGDVAANNTPMFFGEWSLATQVSLNASDPFYFQWADAQKFAYSQPGSRGWIFWNFRVEQSAAASDLIPQWSYLDALEQGIFTQDPSDYHNPNVCANYTTTTSR